MLSFFEGEAMQIIRKDYSGFDSAGNPIFSNTTIDIIGLYGERSSSEHPGDLGSRIYQEAKIVLDGNTEIRPGDRFVVRGEEWVIDGPAIEVTQAFPGGFIPDSKTINIKRGEANG